MADFAEELPALQVVAAPAIEKRILVLRGRQVMLDEDLADLYGVETRVLVQQVRRNERRFPADFMFQLSAEEFSDLKSQFVISSGGYGGRRKRPLVFTEQGVAMLSGVLRSDRAVAVKRPSASGSARTTDSPRVVPSDVDGTIRRLCLRNSSTIYASRSSLAWNISRLVWCY